MTSREVTDIPTENGKLIEKVVRNLQERSVKALEMAKEAILSSTVECDEINEAFKHYTRNWCDYIHPGLVSIACEAVGGNLEKAIPVQVVMLLLSAAFDLHDDVIDGSEIKYGKPTVFGKFGKDITLLVGDAFLIKALALLHELESQFSTEMMNAIWNIVTSRFFELGDAEALEVSLKGDIDASPEDCLGILRKKASTFEAHMQVGAIVGNGTADDIDALGNYGRILGVLMGVREDSIDIFEPDELQNRMKNECLPLPILYAFKNLQNKRSILNLLSKPNISSKDAESIVDLVFEANEVKMFEKRFQGWVKEAMENVSRIKNKNLLSQMEILIKGTIEDI
ncbi:MAG: polyprenyl synthetase family protein [Candidatus Bathyarchaeota archaeon]|nr:polyprenyl synthetase family protein [Candidatus Bathyarchaeota archaeon]